MKYLALYNASIYMNSSVSLRIWISYIIMKALLSISFSFEANYKIGKDVSLFKDKCQIKLFAFLAR